MATSKIDHNVRFFRRQIKHELQYATRVIYDGSQLQPPAARVATQERAAAMGLVRDKYWYQLACVHNEADVQAIIDDLEQNLIAPATGQGFIQGVQISISVIRRLLGKSLAGQTAA
jgi:hypothetical protein